MESVGRLAGGVAHDLNNLLAPIIGYCDMLLDELDSKTEHHENVGHILTAAERARDLTHQLLAFGRKQVLQLQLLDINTLVRSLHEVLRRTIPENIEVLTFLTEDIHAVKADRSQLEQVILNLVVNAQTAMPTGGTLTIETGNVVLDEEYAATHVGVSPGRHVLLIISDTSVGMDAATLERVFEPFFSTKSEGQGSGLGLATVYGIVKQHNGHIWVYSERHQGTTFKIYFPTEGIPPQTEGEKEATAPAVGGKEAILVVEDNELVRALAQQVLTKFGYTAYVAESPRQALQLLADPHLHIDMLLSDVVMPEMNGKELYHKIIADRPGLKVLYMSGHTENVIAHQGILDTDVPFISKPFNVRTLLAAIRKVLSGV
jgi:CheY-like chemotaxis protein